MKKFLLTTAIIPIALITNATIYLNLKCYIQGYYIGSGQMTSVFVNQGCSGADSSKTCNLVVELHSAYSPYSVVTNGTDNFVNLTTSGDAYSCSFNIAASDTTYYYIVVKSFNALDTWSSTTVRFPTSNSTASYDFTDDSAKAYGNNMANLGSGYFGFYSGEVVNTGCINTDDQNELDMEIDNYYNGCGQHGDLNGDGNVDLLDIPFVDDNLNICVSHP